MKLIHTLLTALLLAPLAALQAADAPAKEFHVSTNGNDSADGSSAHPFATIRRAQEAVRKSRKEPADSSPTRVVIHGGTYFIDSPIVLKPEDSGTAQAPVIYEAAPGETPVVSGGRILKGWKQEKDGTWTTVIPEVKAGKWFFQQLFVNGESRPRARTPNAGFFRATGFNDGELKPDRKIIHQRFGYKPGDIDPDWQNIDDMEVVFYWSYVDFHIPVVSIDREKSIVALKYPVRRTFREEHGDSEQGLRYVVHNVREAMDEPGEWYLNRKSGLLSYIPKPGEKIAEAQIVAPVQPSLIELRGIPENQQRVSNVQFKGISFQHVNYRVPGRTGPAEDLHGQPQPSSTKEREKFEKFIRLLDNTNFQQGSALVPGAIILQGSKFIRFENCSFKNLGTFAFDIRNGSSDCAFVANKITHVGAGGFKINGGKETPEDHPDFINASGFAEALLRVPPTQRVSRLEIRDNLVSHYGEVYACAVGVLLMNADECLISNNEVGYGYNSGISAGWTWGYGHSISWNNRIEFNHVHHIGLNTLSDLGGIYTLGVSPGTTIRNNVIHDVTCGVDYGYGIYLDEGSTHILVENNIVYDTDYAPFHINYGKEIAVRNNIFAFGRKEMISRNHIQPHDSFCLENNILYTTESFPFFTKNVKDIETETTVLLRHRPETKPTLTTFTSDWNVFYNPLLPVEKISLLNDVSWEQWRARGKDVHSLCADPLFVDPAKRDFRLKPGSPAFKLGFLPIDTSHVGPQQEPGGK